MSESRPTGAPQPQAGELGKANSTAMVVVGCKLPNGLLCELGKVGDENYQRVRLNGANDSRIVGGFGFTDVSGEFWTAWHKKNKHLEFVRKGLVFVHNDLASAHSFAKERAALRTGLEPLNPDVAAENRIKGLLGPDGKPIVEADTKHMQEATAAVQEVSLRRAAG